MWLERGRRRPRRFRQRRVWRRSPPLVRGCCADVALATFAFTVVSWSFKRDSCFASRCTRLTATCSVVVHMSGQGASDGGGGRGGDESIAAIGTSSAPRSHTLEVLLFSQSYYIRSQAAMCIQQWFRTLRVETRGWSFVPSKKGSYDERLRTGIFAAPRMPVSYRHTCCPSFNTDEKQPDVGTPRDEDDRHLHLHGDQSFTYFPRKGRGGFVDSWTPVDKRTDLRA